MLLTINQLENLPSNGRPCQQKTRKPYLGVFVPPPRQLEQSVQCALTCAADYPPHCTSGFPVPFCWELARSLTTMTGKEVPKVSNSSSHLPTINKQDCSIRLTKGFSECERDHSVNTLGNIEVECCYKKTNTSGAIRKSLGQVSGLPIRCRERR